MTLPTLPCGCCAECCDDGGPWCRQHGCDTCAPSLLPDLPVMLSCRVCRTPVREANVGEIAAIRAGVELGPVYCRGCYPSAAA